MSEQAVGRPKVLRDRHEIRIGVERATAEHLDREAKAKKISVSELCRRILAEHQTKGDPGC